MFSVEVSFKVNGQEVPLDAFVEGLLAKTLSGLESEGRRRASVPGQGSLASLAERMAQPKAISVKQASELLGLSSYSLTVGFMTAGCTASDLAGECSFRWRRSTACLKKGFRRRGGGGGPRGGSPEKVKPSGE